MIKRYYAAPEVANTVWLFIVGWLLIAVPAMMAGEWERVINVMIIVLIITYLIWLGAKYGTYIAIDEEKKIVGGKVHFIPGKGVFLPDVVELEVQGSFAGTITQIFMICKDKNGKLIERGLGSKEMFTKKDLKELIKTIHQVNPNIKIPEELLK